MEPWREELYHHGIKGQRWGVRRYQNSDGSLTSAGEKRYSSSKELDGTDKDRKKREEKALRDAHKYSTSHARLEDTTRILVGGLKPGQQRLVTSDVKKDYSRQVKQLQKTEKILNKKYSDVRSEIITRNGKEYVYTLLTDKKYGFGAEVVTELKVPINGLGGNDRDDK